MFQDYSPNPISIAGIVDKNLRNTSMEECQIDLCTCKDAESQTINYADKKVQTEIRLPLFANYDDRQLALFLKEAYGIIEEEVKLPCPEFMVDVDESDFFGKCKKLCEINEPPQGADKIGMRVTLLLWKKEKNLLYVGYSSEHNEWCNHFGIIRIYDFREKSSEFQLNLLTELSAPACITCIDIHPIMPNILAGGTFSGEIVVWNTSKSENSVAQSVPFNSAGNGHSEAVSQLIWVRNIDINNKNPFLISSGLDGVLIVWQYSAVSEELLIFARLLLQSDDNRRVIKTDFFGLYDAQMKITCFSISTYNPTDFVAGTDAGCIMSYSMNSIKDNQVTRLARGEPHIIVTNSVTRHYEGHTGSVTDIQHMKCDSCVERFATSGLDKCVKVFKESQESPLFVFFCEDVIFGLSFWISDPSKLVAWGCESINVYDVLKGEQLNSPSLVDELQKLKTTSFTTNGYQTILLGKINGSVTVWKVMDSY